MDGTHQYSTSPYQWVFDKVESRRIIQEGTLNEFIYKYRRAEKFTMRGKEYENSIVESHNDDILKIGYSMISQHESVTGETLFYIPIK